MASRQIGTSLAVGALLVVAGASFAGCAGTPWDPQIAINEHRNLLSLHGIRARAEIVSTSDQYAAYPTRYKNFACYCIINVHVFPPDGAPFDMTVKHDVTAMKVPLYQTGSILTIRYLPGDLYNGIVEAEGYVAEGDAGVTDAASVSRDGSAA